ncbi:DNA cytosine methyltransferase [Alistipes communis]|uniref:DNA cytosine methyltransferase n=1 Tax=Alistipes communis TaxID=2585118 RepID=UPI00316ADB81
MTMTHASLFSGIGGFDLAAAWAGWTNVFNCEIDPFCRRVLKYHFPESEQYEDIRTTDFTVWRDRVDVLTGGFPCQPFSLAGKRRGTADDRYLWPAMLGVVRTVRPHWVVGENVLGIVNWSQGMVFEQVCADLEAAGYEVQAYLIPAAGVGAPHLRYRTWFVPTVVTQGLKVHGKSGSEPLPPALLPTPVASDCGSGRVNRSLSKGATARPTLALAARMGLLSTTTACDAKNNSFPLSHAKRKSGVVHDVMISHPSRTGKGSRLNPRYVARMMGFPPDWTELPFRHGAASRSKPTATP